MHFNCEHRTPNFELASNPSKSPKRSQLCHSSLPVLSLPALSVAEGSFFVFLSPSLRHRFDRASLRNRQNEPTDVRICSKQTEININRTSVKHHATVCNTFTDSMLNARFHSPSSIFYPRSSLPLHRYLVKSNPFKPIKTAFPHQKRTFPPPRLKFSETNPPPGRFPKIPENSRLHAIAIDPTGPNPPPNSCVPLAPIRPFFGIFRRNWWKMRTVSDKTVFAHKDCEGEWPLGFWALGSSSKPGALVE